MCSLFCSKPNSNSSFTTSNYKVTTSPKAEWTIVVYPTSEGVIPDMRHGRIIPRIEDLMQMDVVKVAKLKEYEVIAVVLYTGPMVRSPAPITARGCLP